MKTLSKRASAGVIGAAFAAAALAPLASAASPLSGDPLELQRQLQAALPSGAIPFKVDGQPVPGATRKLTMTPVDRCTSRFDLSQSALTYQGKAYPAQSASAVIDWSKLIWMDYAETKNGHMLVLAVDRTATSLPILDLGQIPEITVALQWACKGFTAANAQLAPGTVPWKQARDPEWTDKFACRYQKVPDLLVVHGWGGSREVYWQQAFEKDRGQLIYTYLKIQPLLARDNTIHYAVSMELDSADGNGFTSAAKTAELRLDGKALAVPIDLQHKDLGGGNLYNIELASPSYAAADTLVAALSSGRQFEVTAKDAQGRVIRRAKFDVSTVRDIATAFRSTNGRCVMQ